MVLKGTAVSAGVAVGNAYVYAPYRAEVEEGRFAPGGEAEMLLRFERAQVQAEAELQVVIDSCADVQQGRIFVAHREILGDVEMVEMIREAIGTQRQEPAYAVYRIYNEFIGLLGRAKDATIAARAADLRDVQGRLIRLLRGEAPRSLSALAGPVVVVAQELLPSDTATLDRENVLGIVTEMGGATSHTAIIANSYDIPAVVGVAGCMQAVEEGALVGVDALEGNVYVCPGGEERQMLAAKKQAYGQEVAEARQCPAGPTRLKSGQEMWIGLNAGHADAAQAYESCDFVGLLRTEFLYMESDHLPTEEEQVAAYGKALQNAGGKAVMLRTLDIGGDKALPYLPLPKEQNPSLGRRGVRLGLALPQLLHTQLRAALQASVQGNLWVMLPMVTNREDIRRGRAAFDAARAELARQGAPVARDVKFGIMIEVPALAAIADMAARWVDFASVGTNDLCQYLCAADRQNPETEEYFQSYSPAMVRVLGCLAKAFAKAEKPLSVCGEMAGDARGAALLAGLGYTRLSMSGSKMAAVKRALAGLDLRKAQRVANRAQDMQTEQEVLRALEELVGR